MSGRSGPQLAYTVFDGGLIRAQVRGAKATYDQNVALYRQAVLTGFQNVEDQLASLRVLAQQADIQAQTVGEATEATRLIINQYKAGTIVYTNVVTVQTNELSALESALTIQQNRLTASVQLIEALAAAGRESGRRRRAAKRRRKLRRKT